MGDATKALEYCRRAAEQASLRRTFQEASRLYHKTTEDSGQKCEASRGHAAIGHPAEQKDFDLEARVGPQRREPRAGLYGK